MSAEAAQLVTHVALVLLQVHSNGAEAELGSPAWVPSLGPAGGTCGTEAPPQGGMGALGVAGGPGGLTCC